MTASVRATARPSVTSPKITCLPSRLGIAARQMNIWLSASAGLPECAIETLPARCLRPLAELRDADGRAAAAARAASPPLAVGHVARHLVAPLHQLSLHDTMDALGVVEVLLHEVDDVGDRFRGLVGPGLDDDGALVGLHHDLRSDGGRLRLEGTHRERTGTVRPVPATTATRASWGDSSTGPGSGTGIRARSLSAWSGLQTVAACSAVV